MEIGNNLRALRIHNKMTLQQLSEKSSVSRGLLSLIERNMSVPTITTLQKIAAALGLPISSLLSEDQAPKPESIDIKHHTVPSNIEIVRKDRRKKLVTPWGEILELLSPDLQRSIEFLYIHHPVGSCIEESYSHTGEECGFVLEGKLRGFIVEQEVILEAGDSIYFGSTIPHRWENAGDTEAGSIWAITPPSF